MAAHWGIKDKMKTKFLHFFPSDERYKENDTVLYEISDVRYLTNRYREVDLIFSLSSARLVVDIEKLESNS